MEFENKKINFSKDALRGAKSVKGYNVLMTLLLGAFCVPSFKEVDDAELSFEAWLAKFQALTLEQRRKVIRRALNFVDLEENEIELLLSFCTDANGCNFSHMSINNLSPLEILKCEEDVLTAYTESEIFF